MKDLKGIKIIIPKDLDIFEADEVLYKALSMQAKGDTHMTESFDDPAMVDVSHKMLDLHDKMYKEMLAEILETLEDEYK